MVISTHWANETSLKNSIPHFWIEKASGARFRVICLELTVSWVEFDG